VRGNRRSDNIPEGAGSAAEDASVRIAPAEPQISRQGLQFAGFTPIQPLPTIKEVTAQTRHLAQQVQQPVVATQNPVVAQTVATPQSAEAPTPPDSEAQDTETDTQIIETQHAASLQQPADDANTAVAQTNETQPVTNDDVTANPPTEAPAATESFEECWTRMVDAIFQKKPAFYHQLRDYPPRYENDIIYVDVENDFQKNQLEMSKRAMLEFWRNNFQLNVNDIEFVIHEHEKKKVIYTSEDKVNNMLEQNPELKDFLQVLNFRIKD
jgi:hypothetical protein